MIVNFHHLGVTQIQFTGPSAPTIKIAETKYPPVVS